VQKVLTVSGHVYSPWIVLVSKKYWDGLSNAEKDVFRKAAVVSRDFMRKDTRAEAAKALEELRAKGMDVRFLPIAEKERMRNMLTKVNANIASQVGSDLWNETQAALEKIRVPSAKK
jgi:TRAP-type C4-dicarboxylate transport system substrate-binding protein